ncbi:MAG: TRAP transporter small permease [Gemmatimonadales bacterium]|jgi:TRAP-type C4-dicarboxylate transport system permease small subunit|nr:TRAP transporter small permease [Gemmatimonadales bacterium]
MKTVRLGLNRLLEGAIAILLAGMVVNVVWQVFTRFVLRTPSSFTEELARYSMIWLGLLGAAYCAGKRSHLALDLLQQRLHGTSRRTLDVVIQGCLLGFALAVMVGGGGRLVWIILELGQTSAALQVKLGYVYLAVPVSGVLIAAYALMDLVTAWRGEAGAEGRAS